VGEPGFCYPQPADAYCTVRQRSARTDRRVGCGFASIYIGTILHIHYDSFHRISKTYYRFICLSLETILIHKLIFNNCVIKIDFFLFPPDVYKMHVFLHRILVITYYYCYHNIHCSTIVISASCFRVGTYSLGQHTYCSGHRHSLQVLLVYGCRGVAP